MCVYVFIYIIKIQPLHKHKIYYDELLADHEFTQKKIYQVEACRGKRGRKGGLEIFLGRVIWVSDVIVALSAHTWLSSTK